MKSDSTSPFKGKSGVRRLINAFGYSLAGYAAAFRHEAAFRQLALLALVLLPAAFVFDVSRAERALMVASVLLTLVIELFNSAIEAAVDHTSLERHPLAGRAKDMGSAAQLTGLAIVAAVWGLILLG
ncbi:diacylglycerol kinase [Crenobacter intestini]|uniref:Diacylglycerol kinase n=1 Tax=Crenobacter intestini TaxID=2563443 RepID=A0A4T0V3G8_9NEIS|nr:diacylglycerol kinase [Crenobacter intestini]TIC86192.1 diacylglycerol kinase [Crenobacter intestini]